MIVQNLLRGVSKGLSGLSFCLKLCVAMIRAVLHCLLVECGARRREAFYGNTRRACEKKTPFLYEFTSREELSNRI